MRVIWSLVPQVLDLLGLIPVPDAASSVELQQGD